MIIKNDNKKYLLLLKKTIHSFLRLNISKYL